MLNLRVKTSAAWVEVVLADFDAFLQDHTMCERKASALALRLASHYPDRTMLVDAMVELAVEELAHFQQCYRWLRERGIPLGRDHKDAYVNRLNAATRDGQDVYMLDRLLICGIVEARGCERFALVAAALPAGKLQDFYVEIARAEARHHGLFARIAKEYFPADEVDARHAELLDIEAAIVTELPLRSAVH